MKSLQRGATLSHIQAMNMSGGVQSKTISPLCAGNELLHLVNATIDNKTGGLAGRHGYTITNTTGKVVVNLIVYRSGATRKYLIVATDGSNEVIYSVPNSDFSGTLTAILSGNFSNGVNVFSATFATKEMFFNGVSTPKSYNGATFATITNAPLTGKFPQVFQQRLYVMGTDGFLYYSDVINSAGNDFTSTTWTNRGLNPNDGQSVTAMRRHRGRLVIFKSESIYRFDGTNEPEPIINVGTHSERGVVQTDREMFFHHHTEIYSMSLGDPDIISRPVEKYLKGASQSNWVNVSAGKDNSNVYFWIGNVTINNPLEWDYQKTYTDVMLVFNTIIRRWVVWTGINASMFLINNDTGQLLFVSSAGVISVFDETRFNDSGTEIEMQAMWPPMHYGLPHLRKKVDLIAIMGSPDIVLKAGAGPSIMDAEGKDRGDGTVQIKREVSFNSLWVYASARYSSRPPFIEMLYIGEGYVGNQP